MNRKSLGIICILGGFLCEASAALPFVAPEVIWASAGQSLWLHLVAALLGGGGAAALISEQRGRGQWAGPALLFALFAFAVPAAGLFAILLLTLILVSHHAQVPPEKIALVEVHARRHESQERAALFGPGPVPQPLVGCLLQFEPGALQKVVLGLEAMPVAQIRPILQRLQSHPDVRVQLYANGLLNDQLDVLERRLATLKQRAAEQPGDEETRTALIETYCGLFESRLIAPDEEAQLAGQALRETETALSLNPANAIALGAHIEFRLLRGEFRDAELGIEQLRHLPGQVEKAAALQARLLFERAAAQEVPRSPAPVPETDSQLRSARN